MKKQLFQELNLNNAFLFSSALQEPDICQLILEIIFRKKFPKVNVHTEHTILFDRKLRSIRLDVYASTETEVKYDLEAQNRNHKNLPKRSRFYQAQMDVSSLKPGEDFNELRPGYVIFICTFDPFGKNRYQYTFEERCLEENFPLGDETKKIFLNTKGRNDSETPPLLVHFLKYMEESTETCALKAQDPAIEKLHGKIDALKRSRNLEERYMTLGEWIKDEAEDLAIEIANDMAKDMAQDMAKNIANDIAKDMAQDMAKNIAQDLIEQSTRQTVIKTTAEAVLDILELRYSITPEIHQKILSESDIHTLKIWHKLAVTSTSLEDFILKM